MTKENILITGGAGYLGSHACVSLLQAGHEVTVIDNYENSDKKVLDSVKKINKGAIHHFTGDVRNEKLLCEVLKSQKITGVIHFAGKKSVKESFEKPLDYYSGNLEATIKLLEAMGSEGVFTLIFSSSATVYGAPKNFPIKEGAPIAPHSVYARTKRSVEELLQDLSFSDERWSIGILRYFNPAGAHDSGLIGENPKGNPNNLMPYLTKVAAGKRDFLHVYGNDYNTPDGTAIRDYIHVMDLIEGHVQAFNKIKNTGMYLTVNLGTGIGHSVLEVIEQFEKSTGQKIRYKFAPRRSGDVPKLVADPAAAFSAFGWKSQRSLGQICESAWEWEINSLSS